MPEQIDLTIAETKPTNPSYGLERLTIDLKAKTIVVQLLGANGEAKSKVYDGTTVPTGATLISALNISNNAGGTTLIKRILQRLITDSVIVGTVSGIPD